MVILILLINVTSYLGHMHYRNLSFRTNLPSKGEWYSYLYSGFKPTNLHVDYVCLRGNSTTHFYLGLPVLRHRKAPIKFHKLW